MSVEELKINDQTGVTNLDEIPIVDSKGGVDVKKYKGFRTKIADVKIDKEAINWFNGMPGADGRPTFNPTSTEKMWKVVVETYPLPELDDRGNATDKLVELIDGEGKTKHLIVKARFNLSKQRDGTWAISKAPRAELWKFMRSQGAKTLNELKDSIVTIGLQPDKDEKSDRVWLKISY